MIRRDLVALLAVFCACESGPKPRPPAVEPTVAAPPAPTRAPLPPLPETPQHPTVDTFHGTAVADPYRWLEDGAAAPVRAWSAAQNARARAVLDALPGAAVLRARATGLISRMSPYFRSVTWAGNRFLALRVDPAHKQQPDLVVLPSLAPGTEPKVLLELMVIDPTGGTAIDWFVPSLDGSKVAVSLSRGGSESGTLHVYETATGRELGDVVPRVQAGTGGGGVAWTADGKGFWYNRYPRPGERPPEDLDFYQQVYFHVLGTPDGADTYALGKEFPRIAETTLASSDDGAHQLALVANGDGGDFSLWLRSAGRWTRVAKDEDGIIGAHFGRDGALWLLSKKGAPRRKVLRLSLATPQLARATVVVDGQPGIIEEVVPTATRLYTVEMWGGPTRVRQFDLAGHALREVPATPVSTNADLRRLPGDDVLFVSTSYTAPPAGLIYRGTPGTLEPTLVRFKAEVDFGDAEVVTEEAISKDGTKVPMYILQRRGMPRDGRQPTLVTGYGGYGISTQPHYGELRHVLLEQGVVYVETALRGGGEFGEAWHQAGALTHKQNVFDDFLACAERLIELGYTTPERMAIEGGSNGGLLMGAALTQRPELFRAVVSHVGIYDMLHVEDSPNGQFNITEFGTVKDPEHFKALLAYSPYHRVRDGVSYPAILFLTGANDPRVDPMQSRKMTARLQAANPRGRPVILRTSDDTGHGMGSPVKAQIDQLVDVYAFVLDQLGVVVTPVGPRPDQPHAGASP